MTRTTRLLSAFITAGLLIVWSVLFGSGTATAQSITNTAQASWTISGQSFAARSNTVTFTVSPLPVTIDTFVPAMTGDAQPLNLAATTCGNGVFGPGASGSAGVGVDSSASLHASDVFYIMVTIAKANLDPGAIDSVTAIITTSGGDREAIRVFETGANTGVFAGAVPTFATPNPPVANDCRLTVKEKQTINIAVFEAGSTSPAATTVMTVLADPFGYVFDSEDGSPVNGAQISLINVATGSPALVFAPDGVTSWPSTVTTGSVVTDGSGQQHQLAPGEYRFPLAAPGQYRLVIVPPAPYVAPSTASAAQLAGLTHPDGEPVLIIGASYGQPFTLAGTAPIRADVPLDGPAITLGLTKTASRDRAQPGDVVFYTITAQNTDPLHAKRGLVLTDQPAATLRLRPATIKVDGVASPGTVTVAADGQTLNIALGTLAPKAKRVITYAMTVRPDASNGDAVNKALVTDARGKVSYASAVLKIEGDNLTGRMTLIGRVTANSCAATGPRPGIPGVRVMLEDGSFAITDLTGRYHFDGLVPGNHVAAVVPQTLPADTRLVDCSQSARTAGSATSRFVSGQGGSLAVADFYAEVQADTLIRLIQAEKAAKPGNGAGPAALPATDTADETKNGSLEDPAQPSDQTAAGGETDWLTMGNGPVAFLYPGPDHNPRAPAVRVVIRHRPDQKVELSADGKPAPMVAFDGLKKSADGTFAVSIWRGIPIDGEVVRLSAVVRNADGSIDTTLHRDVHFTGLAASVQFIPAQSRLVADGRTRPVIAVRLRDRAGRPLRSGVSGDFQLSAPYESAEALDAMQGRALTGLGRNTPHWSIKGDDGIALIELAPTLVSGALQLDFRFIDGRLTRHQMVDAWIVPGDQNWTLVGLAEGSFGARTIADAMQRSGRFESDLGKNVRTAFYAKGRVPGSALLTIAYDSAKQRSDQRLLGTIDPRAYYTVFADGSDRRFDAASRNKLYLRLESRNFYALFGDFEAGFSQTQLTRYQRTATGLKTEGRLGGLHAQGFAARIAASHQRDEIQGGGISGPYALSSRAIIANSERVVIETRDRFRSEVIVDSRTLTRFTDYNIDLLAGTITFKAPVLSRDSAQNPQFIVIDYEADTLRSGGRMNAGGRVDYTAAKAGVRIGATFISDAGQGPRTAMGGVDIKAALAPGTELRAEIAASRRAGATASAWLAEVEHHDGRFDVLAYARSMDQAYGIGQTNGVEAGRRKYGIDGRLSISDALSVTASGWIDDSLADAAHREAVQLHGEYRRGKDTFRAGISILRDRLANGAVANSTVLDAGATRRLFDDRLEVGAASSIGLGNTNSVDLPARHQLTLRYAVSSNMNLIGSYEIAKGNAVNARTGRLGFELTPWRGARVATSLARQDIAEFGQRSYAAFGLAQSFDISRNISVDATIDSNMVISGLSASKIVNRAQPATSGGYIGQPGGQFGALTEDFTALSLGATYRAALWTATLRSEWRGGELADRTGITFGAIRQLGNGSVVGSGVTWTRASGAVGSTSEILDGALALALRPASSPLAMLAKLEFRSDKIAGAAQGLFAATGPTALDVTGNARSSRIIGSMSLNFSPRTTADDKEFVQRSEIGLFSALRYSFDCLDGTDLASTSLLTGLDAHLGIGSRLELGGTVTVRTNLSDGVTQFSFGPSIGVVPARDLLISAGYNLSGFRDRDFSAARNTRRGLFLNVKAKFDTGTLESLGITR